VGRIKAIRPRSDGGVKVSTPNDCLVRLCKLSNCWKEKILTVFASPDRLRITSCRETGGRCRANVRSYRLVDVRD
jgi:hypothetical protein